MSAYAIFPDHPLVQLVLLSPLHSTRPSRAAMTTPFEFNALLPLERLDASLWRALQRASRPTIITLPHHPILLPPTLSQISGSEGALRLTEASLAIEAAELAEACERANVKIKRVYLADPSRWSASWRAAGFEPWAELRHPRELAEAASSVAGFVLSGEEAAGRHGELGAFLFLQRALDHFENEPAHQRPLLLRGGLSPASAAMAAAAGAQGVVLDEQFLLCAEARTDPWLKSLLPRLSASDGRSVEGWRLLERPGRALRRSTEEVQFEEVASLLGGGPASEIPLSLDHPWVSQIVPPESRAEELFQRFEAALHEAQSALRRGALPLAPSSGLANAYGLEFPLAQGPMTRVSDQPDFTVTVSEAGALPFFALSLLTPERARPLLEEIATRLGDRPWGVGVLGFAPQALRAAQLALLLEFKPPVVLIAGGRPSQARPLEQAGVCTFLHAPSPTLLEVFLRDGHRRFVFEGSECGGHIGPTPSFSLWSAQIQVIERWLEEQGEGEARATAAAELELFFAGGLHDARSAAMLSAGVVRLSEEGVKIGALMGSAYLFTEEATHCGAIGTRFQEAALGCVETALLESAPGHRTRCAVSPFVEQFQAKRRELEAEGVEARERWAQLEQLNVGRLRIASKGIERHEGALRPVGETRQVAEGLFMLGEVATLRRTITNVAALHRSLSMDAIPLLQTFAARSLSAEAKESPQINSEEGLVGYSAGRSPEIAIIGMACLFPGADDLDSYWALLQEGRDAIGEIPAHRWPVDIYYDPDAPAGEKSSSRWGGFINQQPFDPLSFGIPPKTMSAVEPVQLLSLMVAARALEDAGYKERPFDRHRCAVLFGAEAGTDLANGYGFRALFPRWVGDLSAELDRRLPKLTEDSFAGILANVISGRIANRLDLGGPNYTVDAACASSLSALDASIKSLRSGESDMVLCGGADLHNGINDYLMFSSVHALSKRGRCRTFSAEADGITLGEGVGVLVLKRLEDARRDQDQIYAVIEGVGASSDGKSLGLTAPRPEGQRRALERCYQQAQVSPNKVSLVEAHGTGTIVGDRTELGVLEELYREAGASLGGCALGSVKSQIGHTKCAAGLAGVVKVALSLSHRRLTPTLHADPPNSAWTPAESPFRFLTRSRPWLASQPRAAVSAFGFGGTNFHTLLREGPRAARPRLKRKNWPCELLPLRGRSLDTARATAKEAATQLALRRTRGRDAHPAKLLDLALSLDQAGAGAPIQGLVIASSWTEAEGRLQAFAEGETAEGIYFRGKEAAPLVFLFPGQGSQRLSMGGELFSAFPQLSWLLDEGQAWAEKIFPPPPHDREDRARTEAALTDTRVAQPALGICDLAAATLLEQLGFKADHLVGHSYGELVALTFAGAISPSALLPLSARRGELILAATEGGDPGSMAAMSAGAESLREALDLAAEAHPNSGLEALTLANLNAPKETVIAGPSDAIEAALPILRREHKIRGKQIPVACAFHSPIVASAAPKLKSELDAMQIRTPQGLVWSNEKATPYPSHPSEIRAQLATQLAAPVRFQDSVEAIYAAGGRCFVEVGPGQVLGNLCTRTLGARPHQRVALIPKAGGVDELLQLFKGLGALLEAGHAPQLNVLFEGREGRPLPLESFGAPHPARL
ncbi:MAG: beta-ketoacyl synthase N-terminal-like domain-containing protein, partial [Myxococcota bacterium]|nr:beta-ketoacyl synthase N-terminal-like domain-containing protein [Myxococcota bacterium]